MNDKIKYLEKSINEINDYIETLFLDENEIGFVNKIVKKPLMVKFNGGFQNYERAKALIYYEGFEQSLDVVICEIKYDQRYLSISHRNILGTIMSLGIKREMIGDIYIDSKKSGRAFFVTTLKMAEYLCKMLTEINHQNINTVIVNLSEIENVISDDGEFDKIIVSSRRLDNIVASSLKISRNDASERIKSQTILVNHEICENVHYLCKDNDLISIRKYGRIKIIECIHETKKERLVISIKRWH